MNVKRATVYPKASEHIEDMQKLISELSAKGYTYETKEGIYFSVSKFPEYGKLSKRNINEPIPSKNYVHVVGCINVRDVAINGITTKKHLKIVKGAEVSLGTIL